MHYHFFCLRFQALISDDEIDDSSKAAISAECDLNIQGPIITLSEKCLVILPDYEVHSSLLRQCGCIMGKHVLKQIHTTHA